MSRARVRGIAGALAVALAAIALSAPAAHAEFGPIQLVSKSAIEQADEAVSPALSGNGDFVAFAGRLGGRFGLFRKDLQTGAVTLVAELPGEEDVVRANPSISADGRYVAFTTKVAFDPKDDLQPNSSDVYVADLATAPPTYELASALNACDPSTSIAPCGLTYGETEATLFGAAAAGRVAISEDGRSVAFLTKAGSDLTTGDPEKLETAAGQVAVRRLDTDETILITQLRGSAVPTPVPRGGADPRSEGAAISGDGSTVAWVGLDLPDQVPMLPDEEAAVRESEAQETASEPEYHEYHEPLWRRIPSPIEPNPATRRIVGDGDPLAPGCPPGGTLAVEACQGPFPNLTGPRLFEGVQRNEGLGFGTLTPQLDRDGGTVAFVGNPDEVKDLFVVNMAPSLSRRQAVRRLTRWVNPVPGAINLEHVITEVQHLPQTGPILGCAISPDGERIAFSTSRQIFPLAPPTLVTPAPPGAKEGAELFQVDLRAESIERLRPGGGGSAWEGSAGESDTPSYDSDGTLLAFASKAFNLVEGDANEASDVFMVESPPASAADETAISRRPSQISVKPVYRMTASASSLRDGRVRLVVGLPGAGSVRAKAKARLGKRSKSSRVASVHRAATGAGVQRFNLRLPRKLRGLTHRKGGLSAELDVDFVGSGGKPLSAALDVRFLVHAAKGKKGKGGKP